MERENALVSKEAMTYQPEALWGSLLVFSIYRIIVGMVFIIVFNSNLFGSSETLSNATHGLSIAYFILSCISLGLRLFKRPGFVTQVFFAVLVDIICLTLFIYFDNNAVFECGILISMAIAGASVLTAGRTTVLFAAIATISIFIEAAVYGLNYSFAKADFTLAGMLGLCYFAIAILGHNLSRIIIKNETLASQREKEITNLEQLNEYVIQHMQTGVIALDRDDNIRLVNAAARQLLHWQKEDLPPHVGDISPLLEQQFYAWKGFGLARGNSLKTPSANTKFTAEFSRLGGDAYRGALIFLHDLSRATQQAQQMKLALLGQLSASIAHEIRSPLSAINEATKALIGEKQQLSAESKNLLQIIHQHTQKIDSIVNNLLKQIMLN